MKTSEDWSIEFDLLYNNISSNQAPGLTDYEKSRFLTQAQESVILDFYKGTQGDAFETTEEVTRYLSFLVKTSNLNLALKQDTSYEYEANLKNVEYPIWFITYQSARLENNRDVIIVPTKQEFLFKDLNNPFRGSNNNRVLSISENDNLTLYSKYPIKDCYIKYLKRPLEIDLESEDFVVEAPESLHNHILLRAVQLAKAVWQM